MTSDAQFSLFAAPYAPDDEAIAAELLKEASLGDEAEARIDRLAEHLIAAARGAKTARIGGIEDLLREYSLSSEEGLALMVLAEALLRVPDSLTADRLIEEKIGAARWSAGGADSAADSNPPGPEPLVVAAAAWALGTTARMIDKGKTAEGVIAAAARRIGMGALRAAARQAMQLMGRHFVFGETIEDSLRRASARDARSKRYSFDMLGEGARTAADAARYFDAYAHAIEAIGGSSAAAAPERLGISIKLSALHPRFEPLSRARVLAELTPRVIDLARIAKRHDLQLTIDAEEADRLELSLAVIEHALADSSLDDWAGFGLAVQAYQKRAGAVIDHVAALARQHRRRLTLRLVKGAYWDAEIKRAQERGLSDYPVFTRKAMTDLNYIACARKMLALRGVVYPQFATHNALTVAAVVEIAGGVEGYEFQRLHGMGEDLYAGLRERYPTAACRIYAPVGAHENLLAYLVRRLLENGANSSFVSRLGDRAVPPSELLRRPQEIVGDPEHARAAGLALPRDIPSPSRKLASGVEFGDALALGALVASLAGTPEARQAAVIVAGARGRNDKRARAAREQRKIVSPIDGSTVLGVASDAEATDLAQAMANAKAGFGAWSRAPVARRAACLDDAARRLEAEAPRWLRLLQNEAGKTLPDAVSEWREAIDFLRYYAALARERWTSPQTMPGPTGEDNKLHCAGRGVFVCISPWNFPLAIFLGQVAAALVSGNSVLAKPAEQTPLIAIEAVALLHRCGVPEEVLQAIQGDGETGAALVALPGVAGVAFTGSAAVAARINRALAAKDGPIAALIAETGGINAMIVDATALPEQVSDDVVASAFRSAGQRCSALRLLCLQEDVADKMIAMIAGAARELKIGDPRDIGVDIGPVIDAAARTGLLAHIDSLRAQRATQHFAGEVPPDAPKGGYYVAPHIFELGVASDLKAEIFGPILHVVRYKASELDSLLDAIEANGFGLTLGVHSRIEGTIARILDRRLAGNCYVNRNMIGAVVGVQPFGGTGLSGTGPKAGGPHYLQRYANERTLTVNTTATGGNAALLNLGA